jgi:YD repeat-containing protein
MKTQYKYPFEIITGTGLGTSYSSLNQIGSLWPTEKFGQLGMELSYNINNGNVIVKDRAVVSEESGVPQELRFVFNSNAGATQNGWRIGIKKLKQLPSSGTAILVEEDGHETTFTKGKDDSLYFAPEFKSGTPFLSFDESSGQWVLFFPDTQISEYYDNAGNLTQRVTAEGRKTLFDYSESLIGITGPSGDRYELRSNAGVYEIYLIKEDHPDTLLQTSVFTDSEFTTTLPDNSFIKYTCIPGECCRLTSIEQSDGTKFSLNYTMVNYQYFVDRATAGSTDAFFFDYKPNNNVSVKTGSGTNTVNFYSDDQARITKVTSECGYDKALPDLDTLQIGYVENSGHVEWIIQPDAGKKIFSYNFPDDSLEKILGLMKSRTREDGRITNFYYDKSEGMNLPLVSKGIKSDANSKELVTRFVYDYDFDKSGNYHRFLRFKISPMGRVTEYRPHADGSIASKRVYTSVRYEAVDTYPPEAIVELAEMLKWVSQQNPQLVTLTQFNSNTRGQVTDTNHFAHINSNGEGIEDNEMSEESCSWDEQGGWLKREVKQKVDNIAVSEQKFDAVHRLISFENALEQKTATEYQDTNLTTIKTLPNGRIEKIIRNTQGVITSKEIQVGDAIRKTIYTLDANGRLERIDFPDGTASYTIYDRQGRLGFTISQTGIIKEYVNDIQNRFKQTKVYENSVDLSLIILEGQKVPSVALLLEVLQGPNYSTANIRSSYQFLDEAGRVKYEVDAKNYITQYIYDSSDQVAIKIAYTNPLSADLLAVLKSGQDIILILDVTSDRVNQYYRDIDGVLIGEKDPAGYVTEYKRDHAGRILEKVLYDNPCPGINKINDFENTRPVLSNNDAHSYCFYNARNLITTEVNAEGYITKYEYLP